MPVESEDPTSDFPVLVSHQNGEFRLRIAQLGLVVRAPKIELAYDMLKERRRELLEWARKVSAVDELPTPKPIPIAPPQFPLAKADTDRNS